LDQDHWVSKAESIQVTGIMTKIAVLVAEFANPGYCG
jgi:hypothetical protein